MPRAQSDTGTSIRASRRTALILLAVATAAAGGCAANGQGAGANSSPAPAADSSRGASTLVEVGYGTQSRRELTSAVGSVSSCDGNVGRVQRVEEMLQGRVSGVDVFRRTDGGLSVRIRGAQSLSGRSEPLYVIDGMPLMEGSAETALMGIPPQDVQRIDVLKDASAAAIYGSRGMNGVVLITTYHGKRQC